MIEITVSGNTKEEALEQGLLQLGVELDLVEVEELSSTHDDTLPGAEPLPGVTLRLRVKTDNLARKAREHLDKILKLIGIDAHIELLNRKRGPTLNILAGEDGALIIGKSGQTLEALQVLINRMVVRSGRDIAPIIVDSENYREKRISRLEDIAHRTADRVLRQRKEVALEPMSAGERKIVHMTLKDMRGIHTISRGEDMLRHVVVCPAAGEAPSSGGVQGGHGNRQDRRPEGGGGHGPGRGERRGEGRGRGGR